MAVKNLILYDSEERYISNLAEMFVRRRELSFQVYYYSDWGKFHEECLTKDPDILLITEEVSPDQRKLIEARRVFVLTENLRGTVSDGEHAVFKYQSAEAIISEVLKVCVDQQEEGLLRITRKNALEVIGVFSPVHRIGKTTFCRELGKRMAEQKSVLYLNLELFSGWEQHLPDQERQGMEDLIYYARQEESNLGVRLTSLVNKDESLDYVAPFAVCQDMAEVSEEDWLSLIRQIAEKSSYDVLILDISEAVSGFLSMLDCCDVIYLPGGSSRIAKAKIMQYRANLVDLGYQDLLNRTREIVLPKDIRTYTAEIIEGEEGANDAGRTIT